MVVDVLKLPVNHDESKERYYDFDRPKRTLSLHPLGRCLSRDVGGVKTPDNTPHAEDVG